MQSPSGSKCDAWLCDRCPIRSTSEVPPCQETCREAWKCQPSHLWGNETSLHSLGSQGIGKIMDCVRQSANWHSKDQGKLYWMLLCSLSLTSAPPPPPPAIFSTQPWLSPQHRKAERRQTILPRAPFEFYRGLGRSWGMWEKVQGSIQ